MIPGRQRVRLFVCRLVALSLVAALPPLSVRAQETQPEDSESDRTKPKPLPFDEQPYKIQVLFSFANDARLSARLRGNVLRRFQSHAAALVGTSWQLEIADSTGSLAASTADSIASLTDAQIEPFRVGKDKVFVLGVRSVGDRFLLAAREFDVFFGRWGAVFEGSSRETGQIARDLLVLAAGMFSPLARLDSGDTQRVTIEVKGGRLPGFNPAGVDPMATYRPTLSNQFVQNRTLFRPVRWFYTEEDDEMKVVLYKTIGWTFYEVDRRDGLLFSCRVHTAVSRPLPPAPRDPEDPQLIAARTAGGSTRVRLVHSETGFPLSAMDIETRESAESASIPIGTTDLDGSIMIPRSPRGVGAMVTVFVRHGRDTQARLPVLPGAGEEPDLALKPDEVRLDIEGTVTAVQEQIIDQVARRVILGGARTGTSSGTQGGMVRKAIEKKDFKRSGELLKALKDSPSKETMMAKLKAAEEVAEKKRPREKWTPKVLRMFDETDKIITVHFDPEDLQSTVDDLEDELKEALSDAATAAAEGQPATLGPTATPN